MARPAGEAPAGMTPLERSAAEARGAPRDRLPCVPIVGNGAARLVGVPVSALRRDGRILAAAHVAAYRRFGHDAVRIFTDLFTVAEAMGARVTCPADETAYLAAPAIAEPAEVERLRPPDPHAPGPLAEMLEAMRIALGEIGSEVPVTGALVGPFTNASFLVGADRIARWTLREPAAVHRLCGLSLEAALRLADVMLDVGCTPSLTDAMSSSSVISPRAFREFSLPYLARLVDHIQQRGRKVTLHICGETRPIWDAMVETGADCLSLDDVADLGAAKLAVGSRVRLMGNVRPSEVLLQGTPAHVRRAVLECVARAYDNPRGYTVASGCSLATETPLPNIEAMVEAVREIGHPVTPARLEALGARWSVASSKELRAT